MEKQEFEVIIIGGSYSGLSAAMSLGRAIRKTLIIDSGAPCNQQTPQSHNFITQDGFSPAQIAKTAKDQVLAYPTVSFLNDKVVQVTGENHNFTVLTATGIQLSTKKILFATGLKDLLPDIPGIASCWGISVIHCPYCHGYEYKGQSTGILSNDDTTLHFSKLISNWTKDLTVFTNGEIKFDADQQQQIRALNVTIVEKQIAGIIHTDGHIESISFIDGTQQKTDALYTRPPFTQHCPIPEKIGCEIDPKGLIVVDNFKKTSVPGVYAAGDCTEAMRSVASSVAAGTAAGALINHELISE
ncbi:thioredoxin reductase [Pedobacter cryoconitis]|uniref:NAD(P)/FAD-dependent oxidoreductase n=1 Tax=Pedobacter cryoconitis TaxID=188932 RepID=UPI00160AD4F2|nr:NAD(P)/FAD-dependent oxidoreductase [Pedobacter cryoconitis]MBB6270139.1 thioredoxin reductase [Pedobacter cryoconitis]